MASRNQVESAERIVPPEGAPVFYTLQQAAAIARRSPNALRQLRAKGRGPAFRRVDGRLIVAEQDLVAWLTATTD